MFVIFYSNTVVPIIRLRLYLFTIPLMRWHDSDETTGIGDQIFQVDLQVHRR